MHYTLSDLPALIPTPGEFLVLVPLFTLLFLAILYLGGFLKLRRGMKTGYTRKIIHVFVFAGALLVQALGDFGLVLLYGGGGFLAIVFSVL